MSFVRFQTLTSYYWLCQTIQSRTWRAEKMSFNENSFHTNRCHCRGPRLGEELSWLSRQQALRCVPWRRKSKERRKSWVTLYNPKCVWMSHFSPWNYVRNTLKHFHWKLLQERDYDRSRGRSSSRRVAQPSNNSRSRDSSESPIRHRGRSQRRGRSKSRGPAVSTARDLPLQRHGNSWPQKAGALENKSFFDRAQVINTNTKLASFQFLFTFTWIISLIPQWRNLNKYLLIIWTFSKVYGGKKQCEITIHPSIESTIELSVLFKCWTENSNSTIIWRTRFSVFLKMYLVTHSGIITPIDDNVVSISHVKQHLEDNGPDKVIMVPGFVVGKVIGRGGKTIEQIGFKHHCKLEFRRMEARDNGDIPLDIWSKKDPPNYIDIANAVDKVSRIVSFHVFRIPVSLKFMKFRRVQLTIRKFKNVGELLPEATRCCIQSCSCAQETRSRQHACWLAVDAGARRWKGTFDERRRRRF